MKINWGFSPLLALEVWREKFERNCEEPLSAKPHSKPPFLPLLSLESESDNGYYIHLRSSPSFLPSLSSFLVKLQVVM